MPGMRSLALALLLLTQPAPAQDPVPTPRLHLPLDQPDPTWQHTTAIPDGAHGAAARFERDEARIDCGPLPIDGRQPFTLTVHLRTTTPGFCTPLMARHGEQVGPSLVLGRTPGTISFEAWSWQTVKLISQRRIDDGRWHQVRACYDPATTMALLYLDGALEASGELGPGAAPDAILRLGNNIGAHQPYRGDLDEVTLTSDGPPPDDLAAVTPVIPRAEKLATLAALRQRLLPRHTPALQPAALADWPQRRTALRQHVADCLGLMPEPPRGALDEKAHFTVRGKGHTLTRLSWNGLPGHRASGWLWLPEPAPTAAAPAPAVLCPHGHWQQGAIDPTVQARCATLATFGCVVLAVDSVHVEDAASGLSSIGVMTWHNLRGIDLLRQRPDVDPQRIAVTGASGGGQQTMYLMALDDRLCAAAPMVMTCYFAEIVDDTSAHCGCNHVPRIAAGTDQIELCAGLAPRPALIGTVSGDWTARFPREGWPELQGLWTHLGAGPALQARHADEGHNYDRPMRETLYAFLAPILRGPRWQEREPELHLYPVPELRARDRQDPVPGPDRAALARELVARRAAVTLREAAPNLPWRVTAAPVAFRGPAEAKWRAASVTGEDSVPVPFRIGRTAPSVPADEPFTVFVAPQGSSALLRQQPPWLHAPARPVLVDPRFVGEWQFVAPAWRRNGLLLGCGEGYQAAHDVALVAESLPGTAPVTLVGLGGGGVVAVLAASLSRRTTRVVTDDLDPDWTRDGNRLPLLPEFLRQGGLGPLLSGLRERCELRLGGLGRDWQGSPHSDMLAPFDAATLLEELRPRSR